MLLFMGGFRGFRKNGIHGLLGNVISWPNMNPQLCYALSDPFEKQACLREKYSTYRYSVFTRHNAIHTIPEQSHLVSIEETVASTTLWPIAAMSAVPICPNNNPCWSPEMPEGNHAESSLKRAHRRSFFASEKKM